MPRKPGEPKVSTSVRLSQEANRLIELLGRELGVNRSGIMEMAIRTLARERGIQPASPPAE
jgi:predicted transcriptional regulator